MASETGSGSGLETIPDTPQEGGRGFFELSILRTVDNLRMALLVLMLVVVLASPAQIDSQLAAYTALIIGVLLTLWTRFAARWHELRAANHLATAAVVTLLGDLAWIALFVWGTGGLMSPFLPLLLIPVIFGAGFFSLLNLAMALVTGLVCMIMVAFRLTQPENPALTWNLAGALFATIAVAWVAYGLCRVLERERHTNELVVRHMSEAVLLIDASGLIRLVNPSVEEILGLSPNLIQDLSVDQIPDEPQYEALRHALTDVISPDRGSSTSIRDVEIEEPERHDLRIYTVRMGGGAASGYLVIAQDVTDLKTVARARESGVRLLSHEIRSPLTTLKIVSQLFGQLAEQLTDANVAQMIELLDQETERILRLVGQFLDLAALDQGTFQLDLESTDPAEILQRVCESAAVRAAENELELELKCPDTLPRVNADPYRLEDVLHNLCDNAVKYTNPGGRICVSARQSNGEVALIISDNGCGIPPEMHKEIFREFVRASEPDRADQQRGLGLGLYIARQIIDLHGGRIMLQSEVGRGSEFTILLPISET